MEVLMKENFKLLRKEFNNIKKQGLILPMRKGSTGVGYTFESLLNKKEDSRCTPDYKGIEIKTKFGYTKSPLTLFSCVPKRENGNAINYIFDNYSYKKHKNENILIFQRDVFCNKSNKKYGFEFKLSVCYLNKELILKVFYNGVFVEDACFWSFKELETKLKIKLKYLAIINAYPYRINNKLYYKYLKMSSYRLKDFFIFLKLIENDIIYAQFYLKKGINEQFIENHGVSFRLYNNHIDDLFIKLPY